MNMSNMFVHKKLNEFSESVLNALKKYFSV